MNYSKSFYLQAFFTAILGFFICANQTFAADAAATVFFKSGNVTANSSQHGLRQLEKDDSIYAKDEVDTADNGRAQLRFTDGGLVSLMPGTIFSVEEYLFDEADEKSSAVFGLLKGGLRTVTGAIGKVKHEDYELKTPVATLGIRGTEFTVVLQNADTLLVHVGRGKVVITNDSGSLEVHEGQNAIVRLGSAPEFTDQEPMFLATAPTGDDLELEEETAQNPHVSNVLTDVPRNIVLFHADLQPRILIADYLLNNKLYNISINDFTPGTGWQKNVNGSNPDLEWGSYTYSSPGSGNGFIGSDSIGLDDFPGASLPYVSGNAMVNYMPVGTLSYSLDGSASGFQDAVGGVVSWNVDRFNLGINLASSSYDVDFATTNGSNTYSAFGSGGLTSNASDNFGFTHGVTHNGSDCTFSGTCSLTVNGFLAGNQAQAAGVNFIVETNQNGDIYGAVPLTNTGGNTGLGGGGGGGVPGLGG